MTTLPADATYAWIALLGLGLALAIAGWEWRR